MAWKGAIVVSTRHVGVETRKFKVWHLVMNLAPPPTSGEGATDADSRRNAKTKF
jgi:hypothetical protein